MTPIEADPYTDRALAQDLETASAAPGAGSSAAPLPDGHRLGGRFVLEGAPRRSTFGALYNATDEQTGHPCSVLVLDARLAAKAGVAEAVLARAGQLAALDHKNVARTLHAGRDGRHLFVVSELLEGHTLRELLARKQSTGGEGFGARGTSNIGAAVLAALGAAGARGHGALSVDSVYVNRAGRVKVADFAVAPAAGAPAAGSDVDAVGRIIYELLVGRPLAKGGPRPSEAEGLGPEIDELVARCCAADPRQRPTDMDGLRHQLLEALKGSGARRSAEQPAASASSSSASLAQAIRSPRASGQTAAVVDGEEKWLISKGKLDFGPFSMAHVIEDIRTHQILPGHVIVDKDTGERCTVEDHPLLTALVDQAKQRRDDERRAHAEVAHTKKESRRGVTLYAVIGAVVVGLGLAVFFIIRMLGSEKFSPSVSVQGAGGDARWEYVVVAITDEGRSGKASHKAGTGSGPGQLSETEFVRVSWPKVSGAVAYQLYRVTGSDDVLGTGLIAEVDGETLTIDDVGLEGDGSTPEMALQGVKEIQAAELQPKISFREAPKRAPRKAGSGGGSRRGGSGNGGGGGGGGPLDLSEEGGEEILSQGQINGVIQRNGGRLARCLLSNGASRADIDFSVAASGRVTRVDVDNAGGATGCIKGVMKSMRFPSFRGTFTNSRFDMSI